MADINRFEGIPIVVLGGLGEGKRALAPVIAEIDSRNPKDIDAFTLSQPGRESDRLEKALQQSGVLAVTHSAGVVRVTELRRWIDPERVGGIEAHAPPFPRKASRLILRAGYKLAREVTPGFGIRSGRDALRVARLGGSAVAELTRHPGANFGRLGDISRFDTSVVSVEAKHEGLDFTVVHPDGDEFFQPTPEQREVMARNGVPFHEIERAVHDELLIRPARALDFSS